MKQFEVRKLVGTSSGGLANFGTMSAVGIEDGVRIYRNRTFHEYVDVRVPGGASLLEFSRSGRFLVGANSRSVSVIDVKTRLVFTHEIQPDPPTRLVLGLRMIGLSQCVTSLEQNAAKVYAFEIMHDPLELRLHAQREFVCPNNAEICLVSERSGLDYGPLALFTVASRGGEAEALVVPDDEPQ